MLQEIIICYALFCSHNICIDTIVIVILGEFVAQFKFTVLLMANGPMKVTGLPIDETMFESQYNIEDEAIKVSFVSCKYLVKII